MVHRYADFDDAFADWDNTFASCQNWWNTTLTHMNAAFDGCPDPVDRTHFYRLHGAVGALRSMLSVLMGMTRSAWDQSSFYESMYWAGQPGEAPDEYELTLIKMLGAYIAAPEIDRRSHRYLLDAFRASMYNKPFDLSYHTEWVRRFATWE